MGVTTVDKKLEIDAPIERVYNQWTQFEDFPRFMEGVKEVHQQGDERLYWHAEVNGKDKEWYARITRQVAPGRHVVKASNTLFRRTREVDLAPGETAEFLGINRPGGGAMGMSILMAVLGVGALTLEFDRVVAP